MTNKLGRPMIAGTCPSCGMKVFRFVKSGTAPAKRAPAKKKGRMTKKPGTPKIPKSLLTGLS